MAGSAVGSGRQRQLLQQAQDAAARLRGLPPGGADANSDAQAYTTLHELARLVLALRAGSDGLADEEQRAIWEQRSAWLHEELVALTAERLQAGAADEFWQRLAALLYAGARFQADAAAVRAQLERQLTDAQAEAAVLRERLASHAAASSRTAPGSSHAESNGSHHHAANGGGAKAAAGGSGGGGDAGTEARVAEAAARRAAEEGLELRTKLLLAQQEVSRHAADARDLLQRLQAALAEKDNWQRQAAELREERGRQAEAFRRQEAVIAELTARTQPQDAAELGELRCHNRTLAVNLETHARVVEKLIGLNTELMDTANARAFGHAGANTADDARVKAALQAGPGSLPVSTHAWRPPPSVGETHVPLPAAQHGMQPLAGAASLPNHAPGGGAPGGAAVAGANQQPADSLTDAFESFLQDGEPDPELPPAGADLLEMPPSRQPAAQAHSAGGAGLAGLFSRAASLALYVAGNDRAIQQRAHDLGEHMV